MKNLPIRSLRPIKYLCALLLLVMIATQFLPFWSVEGQSVSISSYVWVPENYKSLTAGLRDQVGNEDFTAGDLVLTNLGIMLLSIAGIVFCLSAADKFWPLLISAAAGLVAIFGYSSQTALHFGGYWGMHLIPAALVLALSVCGVVLVLTKKIPVNS